MALRTFLQYIHEQDTPAQGEEVPPVSPQIANRPDTHDLISILRDLATYHRPSLIKLLQTSLQQDLGNQEFADKLDELLHALTTAKEKHEEDEPIRHRDAEENDYSNTVTPPSADRQGSYD